VGVFDAVRIALPYAPSPKKAATLKLIIPVYPHWTFSPIANNTYMPLNPRR
jgi:hypothetical protein